MDDQTVFDFEEAERRKDIGIFNVSHNNHLFLRQARQCAVALAEMRGEITCDDVREACNVINVAPAHHNAWGAVFKDRRLVFTGRYKKSALVQGHGNLQRVWRLAPDERM